MVAARNARKKNRSLRIAILILSLGLGFVSFLFYHKDQRLKEFAESSGSALKEVHSEFENTFRASFYFFYRDQFLPKVDQILGSRKHLERIRYIGDDGLILFDSESPPHREVENGGDVRGEKIEKGALRQAVMDSQPLVVKNGFRIHILRPSSHFSILYTFNARFIQKEVWVRFGAGVGFAFISLLLFFLIRKIQIRFGVERSFRWGLKPKFLLVMLSINFVTGAIIFVTLSELQKQQETQRIKKESVLFSRFSSDKIVSSFSNFYYFYYQDKFLPSIKSIVATNENLVGLKIINFRSKRIRFDSEEVSGEPLINEDESMPLFSISKEESAALEARGEVSRFIERDQEPLLSVVSIYRNDNQEPLFYVEYVFSFHSLVRSVSIIRNQILLDLVPSMVIGFIIAIVFAQLMIAPIKRLVAALGEVKKGNFDVSVDLARTDELGDLLESFNSMTLELQKKQELRKYLSDSTYRQVMESPEVGGGTRLRGTRTDATVLFSDIRNFVAHCENMDAEEVTGMLNEYFTEMVDVVHKNHGEIDKFIGDALLAVFYETPGDLAEEPNTSVRAIYCALEMRERLKQFNAKRQLNGKAVLEIGVGITFGELISGPIGSKDRRDFTVIGDVVNLANRIEKVSKKGRHTRIVFSDQVRNQLEGLLECEKIDVAKIRGKEEVVEVFELIRVRNLEELATHLESDHQDRRMRAVELLGHSRNREAIPILIGVLAKDDEVLRINAVSALARLSRQDDSEILEPLFSQLSIEKSPKVTSVLISSIGKICRSERLLDLSVFLNSTDERIVANTVEAMGELRDPRVVDWMLPKLSSVNNRVKANAAMALFSAGRTEVVVSLKPMLMHPDPLMRSSAAFALGELSHLAHREDILRNLQTRGQEVRKVLGELQECVPMLVTLLRDSEPMVKRQAVIALGKMKDKSAVLPMIDNIDFDHDSKEMLSDFAQALRSIGSHRLIRDVLEKLA